MRTIRILLWVLVILAGGFYIYLSQYRAADQGRATEVTETAPYGGPFELTDHHGNKFSSLTTLGRYRLMYFGYSYCPDVCPLDLLKITKTLEGLEAAGVDIEKIKPLFISVDPARDTVEALASYMPSFHPAITALTGSEEEIAAVAKKYRIYYRKRQEDGLAGYLMDHLNVIILIKPDGSFDRFFTADDTPDDMIRALKARIEQ